MMLEEREVHCRDGSRWKVIAVTRSSPFRMELVFEPLNATGPMLRGEVEASELADLTPEQLCFLIQQARDADES